MASDFLSVKNLCVRLREPGRWVLRNVSFEMQPGSVVAVVGGSGSGKTTLGVSLLGLLPSAMELAGGEIFFEGRDLLHFSSVDWIKVRGRRISMVFQEPVSAMDPVYSIGFQIAETIEMHRICSGRKAVLRACELLEICGIPDPERVAKSYPFELSGGLRQRAMIALALAANPSLLIADEPTSNLDVVLQARIIELFRDLQKRLELSLVLITHDLGVARSLADQVVVVCKGEVVEAGPAEAVLYNASHAYTKELMSAEGL